MAANSILSLYPYNPMLYVLAPPSSSSSHGSASPFSNFGRQSKFVVLSAQSNPKILKTNRKSVYGKTLSPYDSDDDYEDMDEDEDDDNDVWFSDVSSLQFHCPCWNFDISSSNSVELLILSILIKKLKWVFHYARERFKLFFFNLPTNYQMGSSVWKGSISIIFVMHFCDFLFLKILLFIFSLWNLLYPGWICWACWLWC